MSQRPGDVSVEAKARQCYPEGDISLHEWSVPHGHLLLTSTLTLPVLSAPHLSITSSIQLTPKL